MRRRWLPVVLVASLIPISVVVAGATPPRPAMQAKSAVTCGSWRWSVKTLSDARKRRVRYRPSTRSVTFLRKLRAPEGLGGNTPRLPGTAEVHTYRIRVRLLKAIIEPDHDVHLVVAEPGHRFRTLIAEFPDTHCKGAAGSFKRRQIAAARTALLRDCGSIGRSSFTRLSGSATITGVGYFDAVHGQIGHSPNGIEVHPVLSYSGSCSKPGTGGGGGGGGGGNCSPAYPDFCIPPPPPDLNCDDPPIAGHHNFTVLPPDPHHLDGDHDGIGCET